MKILIVDDHSVVREGIAALLQQMDADTTVLLAGDSDEGLKIAELNDDLDAVLLDLIMPGRGGIAVIGEFGKRRPELPVIVLSSSEDPNDVRRALSAGALGFVPKSANPRTLVSAVLLVLSGEIYVPPLMVPRPNPPAGGAPRETGPAAVARLTERQLHVLKLLCDGLQNKEIGQALGMADKTVKTHISAIFKTLNVVNRVQAANVAREAQLV
jgi:two-component system, NarL family, nitrate/nitrite response regulator NarL